MYILLLLGATQIQQAFPELEGLLVTGIFCCRLIGSNPSPHIMDSCYAERRKTKREVRTQEPAEAGGGLQKTKAK
jgi:hypothetical protein